MPPAPPSPEVAEVEPCQAVSHPNGRLATITCGANQEPLRNGGYRWQHFTGFLTTYHPHGGVHEVLSLNDGVLDGLVEVYDPLGHLLSRELFRKGLRQDRASLPAGVPLTDPVQRPAAAAGSAAPAGTAATTATATATTPMAAEAAPLPVSSQPARPVDADELAYGGLAVGLRAVGGVSSNAYGSFTQLGPALDVLWRLTPRFALELRGEFQGTVSGPVDYQRLDVPLTLGVRGLLGSGLWRPYLLAALGADYAWRRIPGNIAAQPSESAWLLNTELGCGVTRQLRGSLHWLAELRLAGRFRTDDAPRLLAPNERGVPTELLGNQFTTQFSLGLMWLP